MGVEFLNIVILFPYVMWTQEFQVNRKMLLKCPQFVLQPQSIKLSATFGRIALLLKQEIYSFTFICSIIHFQKLKNFGVRLFMQVNVVVIPGHGNK